MFLDMCVATEANHQGKHLTHMTFLKIYFPAVSWSKTRTSVQLCTKCIAGLALSKGSKCSHQHLVGSWIMLSLICLICTKKGKQKNGCLTISWFNADYLSVQDTRYKTDKYEILSSNFQQDSKCPIMLNCSCYQWSLHVVDIPKVQHMKVV